MHAVFSREASTSHPVCEVTR